MKKSQNGAMRFAVVLIALVGALAIGVYVLLPMIVSNDTQPPTNESSGQSQPPQQVNDRDPVGIALKQNADYAVPGNPWYRTDAIPAFAEGDYSLYCEYGYGRFRGWQRFDVSKVDNSTNVTDFDAMYVSGDRMLFIQKNGFASVIEFEPEGMRILAARSAGGAYVPPSSPDADPQVIPRCS